MKIVNINGNYGEAVEFDSVEEMLSAVRESFPEVEELTEDIDYEIID